MSYEGDFHMAYHYTNEQKIEMIKLRTDGYLLEEISKIVGVNNLSTIQKICVNAGLPKQTVFIGTKTKYLPGQRYHSFVLVRKISSKRRSDGKSNSLWECKCDCGKIFNLDTNQIRCDRVSCGCHSTRSLHHEQDGKLIIGKLNRSKYICSAKDRELYFDLSQQQFDILIFDNCYYCGIPPAGLTKVNKHKEMTNGIDRVNSDIGYTVDNCVPCCWICNRAKADMSFADFIHWLKRMAFIWNGR
jgi:hypothetical protein